jgi:hypothetical protein
MVTSDDDAAQERLERIKANGFPMHILAQMVQMVSNKVKVTLISELVKDYRLLGVIDDDDIEFLYKIAGIIRSQKSGVGGIHWVFFEQKWRVQLSINKVRIKIGSFYNIDDAVAALLAAKEQYVDPNPLQEHFSRLKLNQRGLRSNNKSSVAGVYYSSDRKWIASLTVNNSRYILGYFENFNDAVAARRAAEGAMRVDELDHTDLSPLQIEILGTLPFSDEKPIAPSELFARRGIDNPTNAQRAALSRSLARLETRKLVTRYLSQPQLQGKAYLITKSAIKSNHDKSNMAQLNPITSQVIT